MGDTAIPQDIISGIVDIMDEVGWTITLRTITTDPIDDDNPGADPVEVVVNTEFEGYIYKIESKYIDGTSVLEGDSIVIMSISGMTDAIIDQIETGNYIVDGTDVYNIVKAEVITVSGIKSAVFAQLRK